MSISMEEKLVIFLGKEQIVPKQKCVDDVKYMCLDKWNRALIRLLTGRALDMREGKESGSLRSAVWDEIVEARQDRANELLHEALQNEQEDDPKNKRKQPVRATSKHQILLPVWAQLQVRGHSFKVLLEGINSQTTIWIEFTLENLTWLKKEIQESEAAPRKVKRNRGDSGASRMQEESHDDEAD